MDSYTGVDIMTDMGGVLPVGQGHSGPGSDSLVRLLHTFLFFMERVCYLLARVILVQGQTLWSVFYTRSYFSWREWPALALWLTGDDRGGALPVIQRYPSPGSERPVSLVYLWRSAWGGRYWHGLKSLFCVLVFHWHLMLVLVFWQFFLVFLWMFWLLLVCVCVCVCVCVSGIWGSFLLLLLLGCKCLMFMLFSESEQWPESYVESDPKTASVDSIISLKKELTPKMCMLCIFIINSIVFYLFCVWISSGSTQGTTSDVHNVVQNPIWWTKYEILDLIWQYTGNYQWCSQCRTKSHLVNKRWNFGSHVAVHRELTTSDVHNVIQNPIWWTKDEILDLIWQYTGN